MPSSDYRHKMPPVKHHLPRAARAGRIIECVDSSRVNRVISPNAANYWPAAAYIPGHQSREYQSRTSVQHRGYVKPFPRKRKLGWKLSFTATELILRGRIKKILRARLGTSLSAHFNPLNELGQRRLPFVYFSFPSLSGRARARVAWLIIVRLINPGDSGNSAPGAERGARGAKSIRQPRTEARDRARWFSRRD